MDLDGVTFIGPPPDDGDVLARLPADPAGLLRQVNGFIPYAGGFHVRGACRRPDWHALRAAWDGPAALWRLYPAVDRADVPFAEDFVGDQFLLRDGVVHTLAAETGGVESRGVGLWDFFAAAAADPVGFLSLHPLLQFQREGGNLEPGQLLAAYPPFCTAESATGVSLAAVPAVERRRFLAGLAARSRDIPDGGTVGLRVED